MNIENNVPAATSANHLDARTIGAIAFTIITWASAFAAIRASLRPGAFSPVHLTLLRFSVASLTLAIAALFVRPRLPQKRDWPVLIVIGFLSVPLYHTALNIGQTVVTAGAASFLINTVPVFTALLSVIFLHERLQFLGWCGIALSFGGVAILALGEALQDPAVRAGHTALLEPHALLILLSALSGSIYMVLNKSLLQRYSALEMSCYTVWIGSLFLLVFSPGFLSAVREAPLSATLAGIYLGIFPAALAYVTWAYVLARLPASRTASFMYLMPGITMVIAWFWLREVPHFTTFIGGALALCGVILVNTRGKIQNTP